MISFLRPRVIFSLPVFTCLIILLAGCGSMWNMTPAQKSLSPFVVDDTLLVEQRNDPRSRALSAFVTFRMAGTDGDWNKALGAIEHAAAYDPDSAYLQLLLARVYLHMERTESAVAVLEGLIADQIAAVEAHLLLGDVYVMLQRPLDAVNHFQHALKLEPDNEILYLRLAMAFLELDQSDEALATLEGLLQKRPDADQATLSLARIYRDSNQTAAAIRLYRRYLEYQPDHLPVVLELGQLLEQHDSRTALELYQETLRTIPFAPSIHQQLAHLYLAMQQPESALEHLLIVREQLPNLLPGHQIGVLYLHISRWQEAAREFRQRIAAGQDTGQNRYYLALALIGLQEYDGAIESLMMVTSDEEIYRDAMLQLAYLHLQQGAVEEGTQLLLTLREQGQEDPEVFYYLVAFFQHRDELLTAHSYAQEAVSLFPQDVRLLYQQGLLFEALDDHQAALDYMERVLDVDENHADALNFLAYSQAESGIDLVLALERAKLALELKPKGYIEDTVGWVYYKLGKYPQSRIHLERAIDLQPDDKVILEHLGDLYQAMELFAEAERAYRDALMVDPDAQEVLEKLKKLLEEMEQ